MAELEIQPSSSLPKVNGFVEDQKDGENGSIDLAVIVEYLSDLLRVTLNATEDELQGEDGLLSDARRVETAERCARFLQGQRMALYAQKHVSPVHNEFSTENGDGTATHANRYIYSLANEFPVSESVVVSVAILKRPLPIELGRPLGEQLQIINLPGLYSLTKQTEQAPQLSGSPFELLHNVVHSTLTPYFDAFSRIQESSSTRSSRTDADQRLGIPGAKKKLAEFELSLLQLQQNAEIPQLALPLHPAISAALDKAAEKQISPSLELIPIDLINDTSFHNNLQSMVNGWTKSIQNVTKTSREVSSGTAAQEIKFWLDMESTLEDLGFQLRSEGVILTVDVLNAAKRYGATTSLNADTGLKETLDLVQKYNQLMRDFPLNDLLTATSLGKTQEAIETIFTHICKKLRVCPYPIKRALPLVEAISSELDKRIRSLLDGRKLMQLSYHEFAEINRNTEAVWQSWEETVKSFTNVAREITKRRGERLIPIKIISHHARLQERLRYVGNFRNNHDQLQRTIRNVLRPESGFDNDNVQSNRGAVFEEIGDVDAIEEVSEAYSVLREIDVLDTSAEGTASWDHAETMYNERTARVENSIIAKLRDRLATAKTANEMFRVFSKFNALFIRPKIRGAIAEYQTQLIDRVKTDIAQLQERFKLQYGYSQAHTMAQLHDLPPVSGSIIWARQIERQLDAYMSKVEDVLGVQWYLHAEGQKLRTESMNFRKKLDTKPVFQSWLQDVNRRNLSITGRLFDIARNRAMGNKLEINVNFDAHVITLFKEVRNLLWLNFTIPHSVSTVSKDARRVYPYAVSLLESIRVLAQTESKITELSEVSMLLDGYYADVQNHIAKGIPLKWESFVHAYDLHMRPSLGYNEATDGTSTTGMRSESKHVQFVRDLGVATTMLQNKTTTLVTIHEGIEKSIAELGSCPYSSETLAQGIANIQAAVDRLSLEDYSNLNVWVENMNLKIGKILVARLGQAINIWMRAFDERDEALSQTIEREASSARQDLQSVNDLPTFSVLSHEISMKNSTLYLEPPLGFARSSWLRQFQDWLGIVCELRKVQASRYNFSSNSQARGLDGARFEDLLPLCTDKLNKAYDLIDERVAEVVSYVGEWLRFQSLWDLQADLVFGTVGDDLKLWLQLLSDIRKSRSTFDTREPRRSFGWLEIDYGQVQTKINAKYDLWQNEILTRFANKLGSSVNEVYTDMSQTRKDLEGSSLEASSTAQAVAFITTVQTSKRKAEAWQTEINLFRQGQTTLARQRYSFPSNWLHVERIEHEWAALNEILERKSKIVNEQTDALRANILAEDKAVLQRASDLKAQWNEERPTAGNIPAEQASEILVSFESKLLKVNHDHELISKAKEALDLPQSQDFELRGLLEEVQDYKSVWAALATIWSGLHELRDMLWSSVQPRKLRQSLETLVSTSKEMPSRMRQYAAFDYLQTTLRQLIKSNSLLADLRSDAVRERHWTQIFRALKPAIRYSPSSMTLGDVWDLNLALNEKQIRDVIVQAQGEMGLEEFLKQVRETWQNYTLDLVNYQNKCRLIRGWDELFAKCSENLNSLQAMRYSPYYKVFEDDASSWEEKLNRVYVLFDVWIDVQRQWIYLEGVFTGNADIKHLLPTESSRFQNINSEFFAVMKKVQRSPFIMDVLNISGVQKSLERLADLLQKIQKALGEYLERERVSFPRFYFVGDEDLLEIIGNGNDTSRVGRHLGKMFAGISSLTTNEETTITGFTSSQGETVQLNHEISLVKVPKVNEWLSALETNMKSTLAELLSEAIQTFQDLFSSTEIRTDALRAYIDSYPAQIVVLAGQVVWTDRVEQALSDGKISLQPLLHQHVQILQQLATLVVQEISLLQRKKCEHLITEFVYQRDVIEKLLANGVQTSTHSLWLLQLRYVYDASKETTDRLVIKMADAVLPYGFEYLGVPERLVRTPLTDRCYLTLTQAISKGLGGSPYGPAGTGKTETVKSLGLQLGRFTLVFCCDDTFDFQAMGRIFLGICQVGAWGCFDEFNRLEERILSAVSQQVQNIQLGLRRTNQEGMAQIELLNRHINLNQRTGIFITMNPGYAGRSNLPDNLKKLFRSVAMSKPDKELIAEVTLFSQGFKGAKSISRQVVPFFEACLERMSSQPHYDFGLRALKSVLVSSGRLKRAQANAADAQINDHEDNEAKIIVRSLHETIGPKLVQTDLIQMESIEKEAFPNIPYIPAPLDSLRSALSDVALERKLVLKNTWTIKAIQLYQIQQLHHGVMMVGSSGVGKTSVWKTLLHALKKLEGVESVSYVIDPKVMSKEALYGSLDSTTREWTDGLFTSILRKIIDNLRGERGKRHWIVFDGDVDPEWVENLNSVLDDNKLLTLPNGERLVLPPNVRIFFEVESLKYATLATVSRCGMVWFNNDNVNSTMIVQNYLNELTSSTFDDIDDDTTASPQRLAKILEVQAQVVEILRNLMLASNFIQHSVEEARIRQHVMIFSEIRALGTLFALLTQTCRLVLEYNAQHPDFPLSLDQMEKFIGKKLLLAVVWSLAGDCPLAERQIFGRKIAVLSDIEVPPMEDGSSLIDFQTSLPDATWTPWQSHVPTIEVNTHSITETDVVIPTLDTIRHEDMLYAWLAEHRPLILCGPPGAGKTMTLFSALRKLPDMEVVGLNFSSATTPDLLLKSFEQHCEYRKTLNGVILSPNQVGRWLVVFCDEINLPSLDKYGTQRVISFMRQLIEQNGFWRTTDKTWVTLERIQFVGACNPPTDAGRVPLNLRFLRHAPVVMVDYPGSTSLLQIYGTFTNAVLKIIPSLRGYSTALTEAMVELYSESQTRFTPKIQPHYIYSPRELTRWVRGIYEAIKPLDTLSLEGLLRIWAHEALRLFHDRLVTEEERQWTHNSIRRVAQDHFPNLDADTALAAPILFSNWLSKNYVPVNREQLRDFVKTRLRTFCEEEVDVPLILYDDALDHVLRIDRVFRQPQGHVILIGVSGSGKTTLSRFVAWMNGLRVFQIKVHGKYTSEDFDEDLRDILRRCGPKGERICFIMDESNVLDSAFLERMNTLLANAEVPGLFEGDDYAALMTACKEGAQRQGLILDSQDELYKWFTQQIVKNLHVVFTMNPPEEGLSSRAATSPALFNRCVLNWFGDWSDRTLFQVGSELTQPLDLDRSTYTPPESFPVAVRELSMPPSHREAIVNAMVYVHHSLFNINARLQKQQNKDTYLTPRHFLDFVAQYTRLLTEKREDLEEQQRHLNVGLDKLKETVEKVRELRKSLASKKSQLEAKDHEANEKLGKMINGQKEAEQRRATSLEVQTALEKQETEVAKRKEVVLLDLAKAEPAVAEAAKSVSNIKKQQLTEVRSMASPPAGVKLALEAVCTLLGHKVEGWKTIQAIVRRDDFIASIVNYDNEKQMTGSQRSKMKSEYLSSDDFTYEKVNRASKACGPLVQWVEAQVNYSEILNRVGPLRNEVQELEEQALQTKAEAQAIDKNITELEQSISSYKAEYAALISETEAIKAEMTRVQKKVERSLHLMDSLGSERKRWEEGSKTFEQQIDTIVGDALISAAFLAYAGYYDQQYRKLMVEDWSHHLTLSGIQFKQTNPISDYLSTADERIRWQQNALPVDELCTENAIILKRHNRYPLIIDPSGRAVEFLLREHQERKLTVTSFLDDNFTKQVESALRFGNPILVQDAEHLDPVLNHVLNREYQRTGGRVLIQLGKQEIDFSPSFKLFLSTRNPSASFSPDICSRTTFVNFTITQSSLQTQSLNDVLKSERPDVDERRSNLIKMQGEFRIHLWRLEKQLLQALNESRGNILDDDVVVNTLETVKKEVGEITAKVSETEGVMAEVDEITSEYKVISRSCSAIFAVLEQLHHVNHFYRFSLQFSIDIFNHVLESSARSSTGRTNYKQRVSEITTELFRTTFKRTAATLLQQDRLTLALLLAQAAPYGLNRALFDHFLDTDMPIEDASATDERTEKIRTAVNHRALRGNFKNESTLNWDTFFSEESAESVSLIWSQNESSSDADIDLQKLSIVKSLRADRLVPATERFVLQIFGKNLFDDISDLSHLIDEVTAKIPIALCCSPGFDASFKVENVVQRRSVKCSYIAMGSNESIESADKAITEAAANGTWVFIKNVHLALPWLQGLEKKLDSLKPQADFRLFLSMETTPKIPVNIIRISRVLMCEQPAGIKANIKDSLIPSATAAASPPVERARLYLLLALLHGVIQERLRYAPTLGWTASWEFNDSDFECSASVLNIWVDWAAQGRGNIAPTNIPWDVIRALIIETYGGKIDNDKDFTALEVLVNQLMVPASFEEGFDFVDAVNGAREKNRPNEGNLSGSHHLLLPSSTTWATFTEWIEKLPEREPPTYLGLPPNAERLLLVEYGRQMLKNTRAVMSILDESEQMMIENAAEIVSAEDPNSTVVESEETTT